MTKIKDLTGQKFGRVLVLEFVEIKNHKATFKCKCGCGREFITNGVYLSIGDTQSCGCLLLEKEKENGKTVGKRNFNTYVDKIRQPSGDSAKKHLYYLYGYKAKNRHIEFELSLDEFLSITKQNCFYCGAEPSQVKIYKKAYGAYIYNGIDRIDNSKGYTIENCVPCCGTCNTAKLSMTQEEFYSWIDRVYRHIHTEELGISK